MGPSCFPSSSDIDRHEVITSCCDAPQQMLQTLQELSDEYLIRDVGFWLVSSDPLSITQLTCKLGCF